MNIVTVHENIYCHLSFKNVILRKMHISLGISYTYCTFCNFKMPFYALMREHINLKHVFMDEAC